jgi:hypothetical protein
MKNIENEIKETLNLLKPEKILTADEYFYAKILTKINEIKNEKEFENENIKFGFFKPALLFLIILINIFSAVYFSKTNSAENEIRIEYYSKMANEYDFNIHSSINTNSNFKKNIDSYLH